jgi:hypothetical protein
LFILLAGLAHETLAANTYRYINDRGETVYGSTVPPQFAKNGYEILNERMQVIETIPRAKTEAELAAQAADRERLLAEEEVLRKQQEVDSLLLRLYRSPEEIGRKRDERVTLIDGQITALTASLSKTEGELATSQKVIADYTGQSKEPPAFAVEAVRIQQEEVDRLVAQRTRLESDRATAIADADRDMKRLSELLGLPEHTVAE